MPGPGCRAVVDVSAERLSGSDMSWARPQTWHLYQACRLCGFNSSCVCAITERQRWQRIKFLPSVDCPRL